MSGCGCEKALQDLEEFLRNERSATDRHDIAQHLEECPDCEAEAEVARRLTAVVARSCVEVAPDELRASVLLRIRSISIRSDNA